MAPPRLTRLELQVMEALWSKGAISIHGRMVERLHLEQAGRVLARTAAMKERGR